MAVALPSGAMCRRGNLMSFTTPRIGPGAKAFSMHTRLTGPSRMLLPKRFAGMGMLLSMHRGTAMIPRGTLVVRGKKTRVFIVQGSSAIREQFVRLNPRFRGSMMMRHKLSTNRVVICRKFRGLTPKVGIHMRSPTGLRDRTGGRRRWLAPGRVCT